MALVPANDRSGLSGAPAVSATQQAQISPLASGSSPAAIIQNAVNAKTVLKRYNFLQSQPKYFMNIGVQEYVRLTPMEVAKGNSLANIVLPIPASLNDVQHVEYSPTELGLGTAAASAGVLGAKNAAQGQGAAGSNMATALGGAAGSIAGLLGGAASKLTGGNVEAAASMITGLTANQFLVLLLKGPTYKKHEFSWKLAPKNARESFIIKEAVANINNWMAPGIITGGAYFTFPAVFNLSFSHPDYLYRFKPAVCTDCSINYNGSGVPAFYKDGAPESITLKMSFWELEYWLKGNFVGPPGSDTSLEYLKYTTFGGKKLNDISIPSI
jgi:hypothetical protein